VAPTFDRRVPRRFADAFCLDGPLRPLVELVHSDLGVDNGLDLRFRARPGRPGARATLYLGLTQVLHVHHVGIDEYRLEGQNGKGFRPALDPSLFDPSWTQRQSLDTLARRWPDVMAYVRAAIGAAPARYLSSEGLAQARLARGGEAFAVVDREVVIAFASRTAKTETLVQAAAPILAARDDLATVQRWAANKAGFGDELDMLAVDAAGRVLVVEIKDGGGTTGVGWTPAQVARYTRLLQLWVDATPWAASILNGMLDQAIRTGLAQDRGFRVADPVKLVPVIAITEPVRNSRVANERMRAVTAALTARGVELDGLQLWAVDAAGVPTPIAPGGLRA
jgi:hypothetical protein